MKMKINPEYVRKYLPDIVNEETGMKWITRSALESDTIIIETKYDGECCFIEKKDNEILVSNKGKTMYDKDFFQGRNHDDFYTEMLEAFTLDGIYIAELIAGDGNVNQFNLYQSAIADGSKGKLRAKVYDIIELENQDISKKMIRVTPRCNIQLWRLHRQLMIPKSLSLLLPRLLKTL